MSVKNKFTSSVHKNKASINDAILLLETDTSEYKTERKANWKSFKTKMKEEIEKVKKSVSELPSNKNSISKSKKS